MASIARGLPPSVVQILSSSSMEMHFQPIVCLETGRVLGYEALCRSQQGTSDRLFAAARAAGCSFALDAHCREMAFARWLMLPEPRPLLFVNVMAGTVDDPAFAAGLLLRQVQAAGVPPASVVLEIGELDDLETVQRWLTAVSHVIGAGMRIAIDDWGMGQPRLPLMLVQPPAFVKVDLRLVRGIDQDRMRQAAVAGMVTFARQAGITLIAEGIETTAELAMLLELGVAAGQGYLLGRATWPPADVDTAVLAFLTEEHERRQQSLQGFAPLCLRDLAQPVPQVVDDARVEQVERQFQRAPDLQLLVVVDQTARVVGLVTRDLLYRQLGTRYGYALHGHRSVRELMNRTPLQLAPETSVDVAAQQVSAASSRPMEEYLLVVQEGRCQGVVSTRRLLDVLSQSRLQMARDANPLTGLPGNRWIQEEMARRRVRGAPFWLVYADLDHFKAFNDRHGFAMGDQVIALLAACLRDTLRAVGEERDFLGHIGGDDFVLMTSREPARLCGQILAQFAAAQQPGWGVSVSLAALQVTTDADAAEIGYQAARIKARAKARGGGYLAGNG